MLRQIIQNWFLQFKFFLFPFILNNKKFSYSAKNTAIRKIILGFAGLNVYFWNGSNYRFNIWSEIQKMFLPFFLKYFNVSSGSLINWSVFCILSGKAKAAAAASAAANPPEWEILGDPYTSESLKAPGVWSLTDDTTWQELELFARFFIIAESRAIKEFGRNKVTLEAYNALYFQILKDLAARVQITPFAQREELVNKQYLQAWEILHNTREYSDREIARYLNIFFYKIELMRLQTLAWHAVLKAEFENTQPDQEPLFHTAADLVAAYKANQQELARINEARNYLHDVIERVKLMESAHKYLDLGLIMTKAFGEYSDDDARQLALEARETAELVLRNLTFEKVHQYNITEFRRTLPVWSTVISKADVLATFESLAGASELESTPYYKLDYTYPWVKWEPIEENEPTYLKFLEECATSIPDVDHFVPLTVLSAAFLATLFTHRAAVELAQKPVEMIPLAQLPKALPELPIIYGPRGAHVVTPAELNRFYTKDEIESARFLKQIERVKGWATSDARLPPDLAYEEALKEHKMRTLEPGLPLPNNGPFDWSPWIFTLCVIGVMYYYRSEIWTFLDETTTHIITTKSIARIRYERRQEVIRRRDFELKQIDKQYQEKLKRFRDDTLLSYAPKEHDLRTNAEVKREDFIQGLHQDWNMVLAKVDQMYLWLLQYETWLKIFLWYFCAAFLYYLLLKRLFPIEQRKRQLLFWRSFKWSSFYGYGKRNTAEIPQSRGAFMTTLAAKWPKIVVKQEKFVLALRKIYYNIMYCSRPDFFLILMFITTCAWIFCWIFTDWRFYFSNPELASAQYYTIDDETWKWSRTKTFPEYETMAGNIYGADLLFARLFEPQYMLYPDGTDTYFTTRGKRVPNLPLEGGCWTKFWAAQITYGRGDWVYREYLHMLTNDRWNDFWVWDHYRGLFRYLPYRNECYKAIVGPTLIHGELKPIFWLPIIFLNAALMWWNFWNPRLGHWEDLDNPDNLISGPDRVYMNETQKNLIETEEKAVYAKKMDEQIAIWKTYNWTQEDPRTLDFFLKKSEEVWLQTRREVSEKHWLPYTRNVDRDGMPRPFNSKERGHDRMHVWKMIEEDRLTWRNACYQAENEQWLPYQTVLDKLYDNSKYLQYCVSWIMFRYKFRKTVVLPVYRSKWEELVQDDPHPDDEIYGS